MSERPQTSMFRQRQATLQQQTQSPLEDVRLDIGGSIASNNEEQSGVQRKLPVAGWTEYNQSLSSDKLSKNRRTTMENLSSGGRQNSAHILDASEEDPNERIKEIPELQDQPDPAQQVSVPRHQLQLATLAELDALTERIDGDNPVCPMLDSVDLHLLRSCALCPQEWLQEPDTHWTWESIMTDVAVALQTRQDAQREAQALAQMASNAPSTKNNAVAKG